MDVEPGGDVLLERRVADAEDVYVQRVTEAGEVWRLTNVRARVVDGDMELTRGQPAWERLGVLSPDALAALRGAIADAAVGSLPDSVEPDVAVIGGTDEAWRVAGRTIQVRGRPVAQAPGLARLAEALDAAVAAAEDSAGG